MTTMTDHHSDTDHEQPAERPELRAVPAPSPDPSSAEPAIDVRLVDRILDVLLAAKPAEVLATFPANPASPSTRGQDRQALIRNLGQFRSHCLAPAVTDPERAARISDLAGRLLDHLNTLDPSVPDAEADTPEKGSNAPGLNVPAWIVEATGWADKAAAVGAGDDRLVDRLFGAYDKRVTTFGLDGLFGDQLDLYVNHRDAEVVA